MGRFLLPIQSILNCHQSAKVVLVIIFGLMLFSLFATWLPPSTRFAGAEVAYDAIFHASARISAASLTAFFCAEMLDIAIFAHIRAKFGQKRLWLRNNLSNFSAQLADTAIFMVLAFYSFNQPVATNAVFLIGLILPYWLLKCTASVIETPFVYLGVKWLKKST